MHCLLTKHTTMPVTLIECPRDAMQGLPQFIPTEVKINYLNQLLQVGFDTLDFGSFVSPKAVPQMRDTAEVLGELDLSQTKTKLLAIVANLRGAEQATSYEQITYLGFPLSVSETFQQRNTNKSIAQAGQEVAEMQHLCEQSGKTLVVYLSMGFGNPYGDPYSPETVRQLVAQVAGLSVRIVALSDTIGTATPENIHALFTHLIPAFPEVNFGAHLHSTPDTIREKIDAAYQAGCRRFDGAIRGFGGCPMAKDDLTGNVATETVIRYMEDKNIGLGIDKRAFEQAYELAGRVFG